MPKATTKAAAERRDRVAGLVANAVSKFKKGLYFEDPITLETVPKSRGVLLNKKLYDREVLQKAVTDGRVFLVPHSRRPLEARNYRGIVAPEAVARVKRATEYAVMMLVAPDKAQPLLSNEFAGAEVQVHNASVTGKGRTRTTLYRLPGDLDLGIKYTSMDSSAFVHRVSLELQDQPILMMEVTVHPTYYLHYTHPPMRRVFLGSHRSRDRYLWFKELALDVAKDLLRPALEFESTMDDGTAYLWGGQAQPVQLRKLATQLLPTRKMPPRDRRPPNSRRRR